MKSASDSDLRELGSLLVSATVDRDAQHVLKHECQNQTSDANVET